MKKEFLRKLAGPAVALLVLTAVFLALSPVGENRHQKVNGLLLTMPEGFSCVSSDSLCSVWQYTGTDKKAGRIILDMGIRTEYAGYYTGAEQVMEQAAWMEDRAMYVNPYGVRMVRGHTVLGGIREARCYVESPGAVFLICINENSRYYDEADCEAAMQEVADSIHPPR